MPRGVGEGFGGDPVGGDLDRGRQWRQGRGGHQDVQHAAFGEPGRVLLQRGHQAELVQGRRPQVVDEPADVGEGGLYLGLEFGQRRRRGFGIGRQGVAGRVQAERDPGQGRAEPVVQVTADAAPLLLPRGDQ